MPIPAYIVAAKAIVEDPKTHHLSCFTLIDSLMVNKHPKGIPESSFNFKFMSVWLREDGDELHEFEHQLVITPTGGEAVIGSTVKGLRFDPALRFQRCIGDMNGLPAITESGPLSLVSQIRVVDSQEWLVQRYVIYMRVVPVTAGVPVEVNVTTIQKGGPDEPESREGLA